MRIQGINERVAVLMMVLAALMMMSGVQADSAPGWATEAVERDGNVGEYASLAVVGGQPAIAYRDSSNGFLKYARYNGESWDVQVVDSQNNTGYYASLAVVGGQPAIAYLELDEEFSVRLQYAQFNGSNWSIEVVDSDGSVGYFSSLAVVGGQPAISYYDGTNQYLKYAQYNGSTWDITVVDDETSAGWDTSLAVVNGQPAISYYEASNVDLKYARFNGTSWAVETVDSEARVGYYTSLATVNGQPAISYYDGTNSNLKYARYNGSIWDIQTVDSENTVGEFTSILVVDGQPAISYYDRDNRALKYARFNGSTWDVQTLDSVGGVYTSMSLFDGQPSVAHYDSRNGDLRFTLLDKRVPVSAGSFANNITDAGGNRYGFVVFYADNWKLDTSTIDVNDMTVWGPNGDAIAITDVQAIQQGYLTTAMYNFTPPGGVWDISDNGTYTIQLNAGEVADQSGQFVDPFSILNQFTVNAAIGETPLSAPVGTVPLAEDIDLVLRLPVGAYYTVVDVYYPNGGYDRRVLEAPACPDGVCTVTIPSFGLTGTYGVWAISGLGGTFGTWTFSEFVLEAEEVQLDAPSGTVPLTDTLELIFRLPEGMTSAVVDVYYPNGGYLRAIVEGAACPEGVCTLSISTYGLSGDYAVWMIPGVGDTIFGQWAYSGFSISPEGLDTTEVDVLGSAAGPLPALDTSMVEAAAEGLGQ